MKILAKKKSSAPCRVALYLLTCMVTRQSYQMQILLKKKLSAVSCRTVCVDMYGDQTILPNANLSEKKKLSAVSCHTVCVDMYGDQTILPNANFCEKKN